MKTFFASVEYERLALIEKDQVEDIDIFFEDEVWQPITHTLISEDNKELATKKSEGRNVPKEWRNKPNTYVISQEGIADYVILLEDGEADPQIDELIGCPVTFRGEDLEFMEDQGLSEAHTVEL